MDGRSITVAVSADAGDPLARWWGPIWAAWPRATATPSANYMEFESLLARLSAEDGDVPDGSPALVVLGPDQPPVALVKLVDLLQRRMLPAVVLLPTVDAGARRLQGGGVIIEAWDAPPVLVAAYLLALGERQSTVRELAREVQIAARYQGGVRGEIDRIHEELNLAAAVQQELLPKVMPGVDGVECAALFRPAGYVSGDIYDFVQLSDRHLAFFIADAVGHGVPAALLTMVISRSLRMTRGATREIVSPGEAMTRLNEELVRSQRGTPRFSTAIYGIIDAETREVRLAGAGHPPPLRIQNGRMTRVETDGALLGVFPEERYRDTVFTLDADETLLLYSDGFETAFGQLDATRRERCKASDCYLEQMRTIAWPRNESEGSLGAALDELGARMDLEAGSLHQIDDVTAVAISPRTRRAVTAPIRFNKAA